MGNDIETVEGEIVDYRPSPSIPTIKSTTSEELPGNAVRAPEPSNLFHKKRGPKRKYASPEQMQEAIDKYFASCVRMVPNETTGEMEFYWFDPPTVPGLARALGMTSKTVIEYADIGATDKRQAVSSPDPIRGASWPPDLTKGGLTMVTYSDLIQTGILIVAIIALFLQANKKK